MGTAALNGAGRTDRIPHIGQRIWGLSAARACHQPRAIGNAQHRPTRRGPWEGHHSNIGIGGWECGPSALRTGLDCPKSTPKAQGFFRIIKNQGGGDPSPQTPSPSPPPQTKVTIAGKNEIYNRENLVRPFLVHQVLGPKPPPPLPPPAQKVICYAIRLGSCRLLPVCTRFQEAACRMLVYISGCVLTTGCSIAVDCGQHLEHWLELPGRGHPVSVTDHD